jgi:hypothetical protein
MKHVVLVGLMLSSAIPIAASAQDGKVTTKTLIMSGKPLGVGGGARGNFGILNVCRSEKVNEQSVEVAIAAALAEFGLSLDPPTLDMLAALRLGKEWRTSPSNVTAPLMIDYNKKAPKPLPAGYQYYIEYQGEVALIGRSLVFTTVTFLRYGTSNSQASQPYKGDYDHLFFHAALESAILSEITSYGCQ